MSHRATIGIPDQGNESFTDGPPSTRGGLSPYRSLLENFGGSRHRYTWTKRLKGLSRYCQSKISLKKMLTALLISALLFTLAFLSFGRYKVARDSPPAALLVPQQTKAVEGVVSLVKKTTTEPRSQEPIISSSNAASSVPNALQFITHNASQIPSAEPSLQDLLAIKKIGSVGASPSPTHMHGIYAVDSKGAPLWSPNPLKFRQTHEQKVQSHAGYCFDTRVSESLSLDRPVPDYNSQRCLSVKYDRASLTNATVVIVLHNENLSVLLRSFHSVLNRTPPNLLNEIILVDDDSNKTTHPWLGDYLDNYLQYVPKTVVRHLPTRHGLMRARMAGLEWSTAPIVVFLDSHIECAPGWLEPLLSAVVNNRKTIVVPYIQTIDSENFAFESGHLDTLGFSWSLGQTHPPHPPSDFEPLPSPVMAGGLLATDKAWFLELGGYDPEMRLYGGEEMEIGFKTWMCGGRIEAIPCSRVGHVFRSGKYWPHQVYKVPGEEIHRNKLRTALIWMDDYAQICQIAIPKLPPGMDIGPLDEMKAIRKKLNCKSFDWYLKNVFPELKVPKIHGARTGALRNIAFNACLDTLQAKNAGDSIGAYPCHGQHGTQALMLDADNSLWMADTNFALCVRGGQDGLLQWRSSAKITLTNHCETYHWRLDEQTQQMIYIEGNGDEPKKCMQVISEAQPNTPYLLQLADCDSESKYQKFVLDPIKASY